MGIEYPFLSIAYGEPTPLPARLFVISYEPRAPADVYGQEDTTQGPLIWDGTARGVHLVRDAILITPESPVEVSVRHRNAHRGEIDICVSFKFPGDLSVAVVDAVRSTASAVMSLLNLQLRDFLTPSAPFQIRVRRPDGQSQLDTTFWMQIAERATVGRDQLGPLLRRIASMLNGSAYGPKLTIALELYAAHFTEKQARVRFLLLVVAMEALATATDKHEVAIALLARWHEQLTTEKLKHQADSEQWLSLDALGRELGFRREDSVRTQVRKLLAQVGGLDPEEAAKLQRRALRTYDRRSTLVHDGYLPADELAELENEARVLLETLFKSVIMEKPSTQRAESDDWQEPPSK